jgi:hypothetical protein
MMKVGRQISHVGKEFADKLTLNLGHLNPTSLLSGGDCAKPHAAVLRGRPLNQELLWVQLVRP